MTGEWEGPGQVGDVRRTVTPHGATHPPDGEDPIPGGIPIGGIILWSGAEAAIPADWALCDGNNGTPNLQDRFVIGAGSTYAPDATGGASTHTHTQHGVSFLGATGAAQWVFTDDGDAVHSTENHLPPYYALCYIMRVT